MEIPFGAIEKELNIDKETFDAIISDKGSRSKICSCLQYCLENVPDLMWTSALALQYISSIAGNDFDPDMSETEKKRKWRERRIRYLNSKGHSDDRIYALEGMIRLHIHGHDIDSKMREFAEQNRQLILDTALFELQAANTWKEIAIVDAGNKVEDAKAKQSSDAYAWFGDADYVQKKLAQDVAAAELELERVSGAIRLYRHGDYNGEVLSFTTNPEGVIINKGTAGEKRLAPDHSSTIDELIMDGFHPVAGFGALMNDYAGEQSEVIFVHLPALPEEVQTTNLDSAYDEWLEENIDQFKDDKQEAAFAKFLRDTPDEDKADYGMIDLIFKTWRQENDIRSRKDGGPGSGNFGHGGRPGEIGGSAPAEGNATKKEPYHGLSTEGKSIVEAHKNNPNHFGESEEVKEANRQKLIKALNDKGVKVDYIEEEGFEGLGYGLYRAIDPKMSLKENATINSALSQSYFGSSLSKEDYIQACRDAGTTPRLHEEATQAEGWDLKTDKGKDLSDGTPVFWGLNKEKVLADEDLTKYSGYDEDLDPDAYEKTAEAASKAIESMSDAEKAALNGYTKQYGPGTYAEVNKFLATGEGGDATKKAAELISTATDHEIGANCLTSRGARALHGTANDEAAMKIVAQVSKGNFTKAGKLKDMLEGKEFTNEAAMSTSPGGSTSKYGELPIQMIFKTPANAKAVNISKLSAYNGGRSEIEKKLAATGFFGAMEYESEVLYHPGARYRVDKVHYSLTRDGKKKKGQVFLECTILTDDRGDAADDDVDWITVNGAHIPIDDAGNLKGETGEKINSTSKKTAEAKAPEWKSKNDSAREEHKALKSSKKAIELTELYDAEDGDAMYDRILEAFQAKDGSLDRMVDDYYDIMEKNGDPTPTKPTSGQLKTYSLTNEEYGGDWGAMRLGELKKATGLDGKEAEESLKNLNTWVGNNWDKADKGMLDDYVEKAPAFDGPIFRGLHFDDRIENPEEAYKSFMSQISVGGEMKMLGPASWTNDEEMGRHYAHIGEGGIHSVVIKCIKNRTSTPIGYINRMGEAEVLSSSKARWTVLTVDEYERDGGHKAVITVVERGE